MTGLGEREIPEPTRHNRSGSWFIALCGSRRYAGSRASSGGALRPLSPEATFDERSLGDRRGESLVPQLDRCRDATPQLGRERSGALGRVTLGAVEKTGQSDDHPVDLAILDLAFQTRPESPRLIGNGGHG
jgi:hypothetical protein